MSSICINMNISEESASADGGKRFLLPDMDVMSTVSTADAICRDSSINSTLSSSNFTQSFSRGLHWQLYSYLVPPVFTVVVVLGCLGNALVIAVVLKNKDQFRNTTNLFILNLALADMLFLVFCVPFHTVIFAGVDPWPFGDIVCRLIHLVQYSSMGASVFTLVAMSLDRYLAVGHPIKTKHLRTPCMALLISVLIWVVALALAMPSPIVFQVNEGRCGPRWPVDSWERPTFYLVLFILAYAIPVLAIFVLSALMIQQLWAIRGPESDGPRNREPMLAKRKVTRLIVVVVLVFSFCWLPQHIVWLMVSWLPENTQKSLHGNYPFYFFCVMALLLSYTNSCMNPVIYAFLSTQFRKGFHKALKCSARDHHPPRHPFRRFGSKSIYSATMTNDDTHGHLNTHLDGHSGTRGKRNVPIDISPVTTTFAMSDSTL